MRLTALALCLFGACSSNQQTGGGPATTDPCSGAASAADAGTPGESQGLPPTDLVAVSGNGKVFLSWGSPPADTPASFNVYRGTSAGGEDAKPIAQNVTSLTYLDESVTTGTRYFYQVAVTVDACNASPASNEAAARPTDADANAAYQALLNQPNPFKTHTYTPSTNPTYKASSLPQPIADEHPEWLSLYTKAWQLAFKDLKTPVSGSGFVSNFIDPAFFGHTFQWDTIFMLQFARFGYPYVNVIGSLDNFYAKQHDNGFICREIDEATGTDVMYQSIIDAINPPLYSWAEWRNYRFTGDSSRFKDVIVPIAKYYDWVKQNRRRPNGSYWNTGLGAGEDDLNRENVSGWLDMTAQQAQAALYAGLIATTNEDDATAAYFLDEYLSLSSMVHDQFWDQDTQIFTDMASNGAPTGVKTVLAFWPMLIHAATNDQVTSLVAHLQNPAEFWRPDVIPVLAADQVGYTPQGNYWNGAVWAPTNYAAINGLCDYGYQELASTVTRTYLTNMATVFKNTGTIWEHYAPESATGEGVQDFVGWSGLGPIALLIENALGIHIDAASSTVSWRPRLAQQNGINNLALGTGTVNLVASPVTNGSRTLTVTTSAPIRLLLDTGAHQATYAIDAGTQTLTVPASNW